MTIALQGMAGSAQCEGVAIAVAIRPANGGGGLGALRGHAAPGGCRRGVCPPALPTITVHGQRPWQHDDATPCR
jgi:hypothetical protein